MPSSSRKILPLLSTAATLAAAGGLAALAVQFYQRPVETVRSTLRAAMLLAGAREEICHINGVPMRYYCAGRRGTPIILIHGLGGSAENWAFLLPLLSKEYLVYALDLPGFGKTPQAPEGFRIQTHALYLQRFLDFLGYPHVTLVGNSLGGWIATRFTIDHPERVKHLYLLNSAGLNREGMFSPYAPDRSAARGYLSRMLGYPVPIPNFLVDAVIQMSQAPAYKGFIEGYDRQEELDGVLSNVQVPTTIIWGTEDKIFPISCAHDFHAGIADSQLILLPGVGHSTQMQAPLKVANIILAAADAL